MHYSVFCEYKEGIINYRILSQNITLILVRDFTKVIHEKFACLFTYFGWNEVSINNLII